MAFGVVKLSKKQRNILSIIFLSLNAIQMTAGLSMVILAGYIYLAVAPVLYSERAEISFVFIVVGLSGLTTLCNYAFGLKINWKCMNHSHKKSTRSLIFAWTCVSFYLLVCLLIIANSGRKVYKHVIRTMKHSLQLGMHNYLKDKSWKVTIDEIQFGLQCCGITSWKDWHEVAWLNKQQVNEKSEIVEQLKKTNGLYPVTPWSCCRINFPLQCLHDPLQQDKSRQVWVDQPALAAESLNTQGCLPQLRSPIHTAFVIFILLVALIFVAQVVIALVSRLLYTSCRNALLLNDPEGVAPGWIFGRGDCGYARGKNLIEIMEEDRGGNQEPEEQLS